MRGIGIANVVGMALVVAGLPLHAMAQNDGSPGAAPTSVAQVESVSDDMRSMYEVFKRLQPYLYREHAFFAEANQEHIASILGRLSAGFEHVEATKEAYAKEPGFELTIRTINAMLDDARHRFNEGRKGYALWRLKTATSYCVSCHSRFQVAADFNDPDIDLTELTPYERAEFLFATRQFDKAQELFMQVARERSEFPTRMDALRRWLVISTRVKSEPRKALLSLRRFRSQVPLREAEAQEVASWIRSLEQWAAEPKSEIDALDRAENLIRRGVAHFDPLSGTKGEVELLRATAILHQLAYDERYDPQRGRVLYLLGLAYHELPVFFADELPELFLEKAIRTAPGSDAARRSYRLYSEIVTLAHTGSSGTQIPAEVLATLQELHDLAYKKPRLEGRV